MDITHALEKGAATGVHDLIVRVYDPSESAHIPLGKQRLGVPKDKIFYKGVEGIWGSVWLEPVRMPQYLPKYNSRAHVSSKIPYW